MKRGDIAWQTIVNLILVLIGLVIIIFVIFLVKENIFSGETSTWETIKSYLRFG